MSFYVFNKQVYKIFGTELDITYAKTTKNNKQ